jgi:hypothetical protein
MDRGTRQNRQPERRSNPRNTMVGTKRRLTRRNRRSERTRIAATAAVVAVLTAGFFAATKAKIELSAAKPIATPSDDEIYTGSILFVPDDGRVCRRFLFDNRNGRLSYGGLVDCESAYYRNRAISPAQMSVARTQAISETFRHH